jgi:Zn-dependent protease
MLSGYRLAGKWKGIPVYFHWTVLLWFPWFLLNLWSLSGALMAFVAVVGVLLAHELGHAYAARARRVHVSAVRLFLMHGQCEHAVPDYEKDHIFIAWGGVLAQFGLLVFAAVAALALLHWSPQTYAWFRPLFYVLIQVNLFTAILNLIPVPPLDGHLAWRGAAPFWKRLSSRVRAAFARARARVDFRQRPAQAKASSAAAADLLERLKQGAKAEVACHRTSWSELARFYLNGRVWVVKPELDLGELALIHSAYGSLDLAGLLAAGHASEVTDEQALAWQKTNAELLAVVVEPYVLVKPSFAA